MSLPNNSLIIIRGVQGSGKSTLARMYIEQYGCHHFEADMFFVNPDTGDYKWDKERIGAAHAWCKRQVEHVMNAGEAVVVSNTFVRRRDLKPYLDLAAEHRYVVQTIVCQGRFHNDHGVPDDVVEQKRQEFEY